MHRSHTVPDIESAMGSPRPPDLGVDRSRAGDAASSQAGGHGSSSRSSSLSCARRPRWPARRSALSHVRASPASPSRPARTSRVRARGGESAIRYSSALRLAAADSNKGN